MNRLLLALGLIFFVLIEVRGAEPPRLVLAHYMPCFPPLRSDDPLDSYGYQSEFDPANEPEHGNRSSKPIAGTNLHGDAAINGAYEQEICLAKEAGIDGFWVDLLEDNDRYFECWQRLLKAAEKVGGFQIGLMPDYTCLDKPSEEPKKNGKSNVEQILHWLNAADRSPALLRWEGKPVVACYGVGHPDAKGAPEWEKEHLVDWLEEHGVSIQYLPTHGLDWPLYSRPYARKFAEFAFGAGSYSPGATESQRQRALDYWPDSLLQMGEVCPIYYNRAWNYSAPRLTESYRREWEWNIAHRDRIHWVQIITWNDYGESPLAPDNNHFYAWLPLTRYYADWFKTGVRPPIERDWLAIFHRPHPYESAPFQFPYGLKSNRPTDEVEAVALLTAPADLVIETGGKQSKQAVEPGMRSLVIPFDLGVQRAWIERDGKRIVEVQSPLPIESRTDRQNLWLVAADSAHSPRILELKSGKNRSGEWDIQGDDLEGKGIWQFDDEKPIGDGFIFATIDPAQLKEGKEMAWLGRMQGDRCYELVIRKRESGCKWMINYVSGDLRQFLAGGDLLLGEKDLPKIQFSWVGAHLVAMANGKDLTNGVFDYRIPWGRAGIRSEEKIHLQRVIAGSWDVGN